MCVGGGGGLLIGRSLTGAILLGEDSVVNENLSLNILAIFKFVKCQKYS